MSEIQTIFAGQDLPEGMAVSALNELVFQIQEGPIGVRGRNGCQIDTVVWAALTVLQSFNKRFPCRENSIAITKLEEALHRLADRTRDREKRGVEGKDKE